jgi:hypothetical protein
MVNCKLYFNLYMIDLNLLYEISKAVLFLEAQSLRFFFLISKSYITRSNITLEFFFKILIVRN